MKVREEAVKKIRAQERKMSKKLEKQQSLQKQSSRIHVAPAGQQMMGQRSLSHQGSMGMGQGQQLMHQGSMGMGQGPPSGAGGPQPPTTNGLEVLESGKEALWAGAEEKRNGD